MPLADCRILEFPRRDDARGSLAFLEAGRHVPFEIKRIFYIFDVAEGAERGGHAHRECHQVIIAIHGSFDVELGDGDEKRIHHLDRPEQGLHVPPLIWNELRSFSPGAVCLVLASEYYDEADYIRDYGEFVEAARPR